MKNRRAFTLFELLVAMTIVVILIATLASTISVAYKEKRAAEDAVESVRDVYTVGDIFVQSLQCALPPWIGTPPGTQAVATQEAANDPTTTGTSGSSGAVSSGIVGSINGGTGSDADIDFTQLPTHLVGPFHGDSTFITFFASGSELNATTRGDTRWIEFLVVPTDNPDGLPSLVRRVDSNLLDDNFNVDNPPDYPNDQGLPDEILINHVISIKFQYSDSDNNWYDTWYSENNDDVLPSAVSMDLTLAPLTDGGQNRVIHRVASIWTAAPPADTTDTSGTTGGILGTPGN